METTHILGKIPKEIQQRYNVGRNVEVKADSSADGGRLTFINKDGDTISADAVEFCGNGITMKEL